MRLASGIILVVVGVVWIFQGLDVTFAPQSFMTNDRRWIVFGALGVIAGGWLIVRAWKSR